jgi:transposase
VPVFGIFKRGGKIYTQVSDNTKTDTLMPIIRPKINPDRIIYPDSYCSYNAMDVSEFNHDRDNHSLLPMLATTLTASRNSLRSTFGVWNQTKRVLRKYNGIPTKQFYWFLKETESRSNYGSHKEPLRTLRKWTNL